MFELFFSRRKNKIGTYITNSELFFFEYIGVKVGLFTTLNIDLFAASNLRSGEGIREIRLSLVL